MSNLLVKSANFNKLDDVFVSLMDVVVNAVWLAWCWAFGEGDDEVASAIENLILDWPMDFVWIAGHTPEKLRKHVHILYELVCEIRAAP